ncbi:hypothetical protein [Janthinobacterium sp.]|uniref:hypothetical protein n=1 Tax=Janthinobacterium sp. TaxID=1871054 RepID=UPI00293D3C9D|nr:hypothetical protein [Janthinobacterium sp.]
MKKTIDRPLDLWRALQEDAGLELRRSKGAVGRDADIEAGVLATLCNGACHPVAIGSVEKLLLADVRSGAPRITVEVLLDAILAEQEGFAAMMGDILDTLVMAEAVKAKDSLAISFSFDKTAEPLRLTLEAFRQQVNQIKTTIVTQWDFPENDTRWRLLDGLADIVQNKKGHRAPFLPLSAPVADPASGDPLLDAALRDLTQLVSEFCTECMIYGTDRNLVRQTVAALFPNYNSDPLHATMVHLAGDAHDGWDVNLVALIKSIADSARGGFLDAGNTATTIDSLLSNMPSRKAQVQKKYSELIDVLNLPAWKKRYELYSVWVGTALLRVAKARSMRLEFHPINGVLSFAFGGSRLASYDWNGRQFDVWAEFRSDLAVKSKKRKKGIQPDFRVMEVALGASDNAKTRFVLECKHYLKPSLSNFTQAAQDYSKSCPQSDVFIVNHGPADHDLISGKLSDDVAGRVKFLGEMTAGARKADLELAIGDTLFFVAPQSTDSIVPTASPESPSEGARAVAGTIRLSWDVPLHDLDLSLKAMDCYGKLQKEINFASRGALQQEPYAELDVDVQEGPGAEQIDIQRWHFDRYEIFVTNYSRSPELRSGCLRCTVVLGKTFKIIEFPATADPRGPWNVGVIEVVDGVPQFVGTSENI